MQRQFNRFGLEDWAGGVFMFFSFLRARISCVVFVLVACAALGVLGCKTEADEFVDDHKLNSGLVGTWKLEYEGGSDTYTITATTILHPSGYPALTGTIKYVYNFSDTAGCIIVQRNTDDKYTAVYFKDLTANDVLLGDAYDVSISYPNDSDPAVNTLDEAKARFAPENAENYGGGTAQTGSKQIRQQ
jgi:hypothetical protein